ncbi:MAG: DNA polymerase III subunit delta [Paludibacteraceae bacterium]|nr:DNA polymerase III subunit delta [Paludibacteraceae bacterium]
MAAYKDIVKQISIKQFMPIYVLMGTEPYYIDKLTELIEASILTDDEKVMNQTTVYGKDANIESIITDARQYPIMAPYRVIFIKEAQMLDNKKKLSLIGKYLEHPVSSTIIVVTYKTDVLDSNKKENKEWLSKAEKIGVVFTSEKISDYKLPPIITQMANKEGLDIDDKAVALLIEHVGSDLTQLESIMKQFSIMLPTGHRRIDSDAIEKVVGISKTYVPFELADAMLKKNIRKANLIIAHINDTIQKIIATLFSYYSNLLIYQYMPAGLSDKEVASTLGVQSFLVKNYKDAATKYNKRQTFNAIGILRKYDIMSKGVNCPSSANTQGLLKEMVYKILH